MSHSAPLTHAAETRFDELVAAYLQAVLEGQVPDRQRIAAAHPDLAEELRAFFADHDWMSSVAGPALPRDTPEAGRGTLQPTMECRRYIDLTPHQRGGLGEVLSATDTEFNRVVAIKRLQEQHAQDAESQRRFLMEAEITALLEHPGVVPVHGMFQDGTGRPTYVMRFIEGDTLGDAIRAHHAGPTAPVAFRRLLQQFVQVCQTIGYAHSRGVIHRDLKPSNIMLGKFGETLVVDWGLAKVVGRSEEDRTADSSETLRPVTLESSTAHPTQMGSAVGTPPYMSPEQAAGRWDIISPATDIYGLGAVLYEILTGKPPLSGSNWPELQQRIQRGDFPRPRQVLRQIPRSLEAICLKAMAAEPDNRYGSAEELATDVERWLADEPVRACPDPLPTRLGRWARRHQPAVAGAVVFLLTGMSAAWLVAREQLEARTHQLEKRLAQSENTMNVRTNLDLQGAIERLRHMVDWFSVEVRNVDAMAPAELVAWRSRLFNEAVQKWDDAIAADESIREGGTLRTLQYRAQRALCLAGAGRSAEAFDEALALAGDPSLPFEDVPALMGVYAIALEQAATDPHRDETIAAARDFLESLREQRYFEEAPNLQQLRTHPQLGALLAHEAVAGFLDAVSASEPPRRFPN